MHKTKATNTDLPSREGDRKLAVAVAKRSLFKTSHGGFALAKSF